MDYTKAQPEDVPADRERQGADRPWADFAALLRANPNEWYEVENHGMSSGAVKVYASRIRNGGLKAFQPARQYEARQSAGRLWARFVG
jgi:hypothetical protein